MSKWAFALAATVAVAVGVGGVGCSGSGGTSTTGTTGTTGGTDSTAFVSLPNVPGQLQNVYLTGQGRATGDPSAVIRRVTVDDSTSTIQTLLNPFIRLQLNGYTHQSIQMNVPSTISRVFDHYNLEVLELDVDNGDGTFTIIPGQNNQPLVQDRFTAYFRVFPARQSSITVRLDDSMFDLNTGAFDRNQFITANYSVDGTNPPRMNGFISDYVMFDISNLAGGASDDPPFPDASGTATAFFMNGDNFAIGATSDGSASPFPFFTLTPIGYVLGSHVGPRTLNGITVPGTYSLVQPDPRQPMNPAAKITALLGTYKNYTQTILSTGTNPQGFEIIAFPGSQDNGIDDCVLFNVSGGVITHLYFGQVNMTGAGPHGRLASGKKNPGTITGSIVAYPVNQITDPSNTNNQITGTITGLDSTDVRLVHSGRYSLNALNLPATFSTSGKFIVYRR